MRWVKKVAYKSTKYKSNFKEMDPIAENVAVHLDLPNLLLTSNLTPTCSQVLNANFLCQDQYYC
jgi:hypothetical protein